jgi:hypothetical protein
MDYDTRKGNYTLWNHFVRGIRVGRQVTYWKGADRLCREGDDGERVWRERRTGEGVLIGTGRGNQMAQHDPCTCSSSGSEGAVRTILFFFLNVCSACNLSF